MARHLRLEVAARSGGVRARLHVGRPHHGGGDRRQHSRHRAQRRRLQRVAQPAPEPSRVFAVACSSERASPPPSATSSPAPATSPGHAAPSSSPTTRTCTCGRRAGSVPPTSSSTAAGWRVAPWPGTVVWATVRREQKLGKVIESCAYYVNPFEWWAYSRDDNWPPSGLVDRLGWKQPAVRPFASKPQPR